MFTFCLKCVENPSDVITVYEEFFFELRGHIHYNLLPLEFELFVCDPYCIREYDRNEIDTAYTILSNTNLTKKIDEGVSVILIDLKTMFAKAKKERFKIFAVGN